jgi:hypothetical protein
MAKNTTTKKGQTFYAVTSNGKKGKLVSSLKLANPVTMLANKLMALFNQMNGVVSAFEYEKKTLSLFISDSKRSDAISFLVRREHKIGNMTLKIRVWDCSGAEPEEMKPPSWTITDAAMLEYAKYLFKDSGLDPVCTCLVDQSGVKWNFFEFPIFGIVYQADDLQNPRGFRTELLQNVVTEAFDFDKWCVSSIAC